MIAKRNLWKHFTRTFAITCILCSASVHSQPKNTTIAPAALQTPTRQMVSNNGAALSIPSMGYEGQSNSPVIAERAQKNQLQAIFSAIDQELKQTDDNLLSQAPPLARLLLAIQREASRIPQFSRNPVVQSIDDLKKRLGSSLEPRQASDFVEMYQPIMNLRNQCNPSSRQNLRVNSQDCAIVQFFPAGWWETYTSAGNSLQLQKSKRQEINGVKDKILEIEHALDSENWNDAVRRYGEMVSDKFVAQFAPAQSYLQATQALRNDLFVYVEASKVDRTGIHSLTQEVYIVAKEAELLRKSIDTA